MIYRRGGYKTFFIKKITREGEWELTVTPSIYDGLDIRITFEKQTVTFDSTLNFFHVVKQIREFKKEE